MGILDNEGHDPQGFGNTARAETESFQQQAARKIDALESAVSTLTADNAALQERILKLESAPADDKALANIREFLIPWGFPGA